MNTAPITLLEYLDMIKINNSLYPNWQLLPQRVFSSLHVLNMNNTFPENFHTHPKETYWKFLGVWAQVFKNQNF